MDVHWLFLYAAYVIISATDPSIVSQRDYNIRHVSQEHKPKVRMYLLLLKLTTYITHKLHRLSPNNWTTHKEASLVYPATHTTRHSELYHVSTHLESRWCRWRRSVLCGSQWSHQCQTSRGRVCFAFVSPGVLTSCSRASRQDVRALSHPAKQQENTTV